MLVIGELYHKAPVWCINVTQWSSFTYILCKQINFSSKL